MHTKDDFVAYVLAELDKFIVELGESIADHRREDTVPYDVFDRDSVANIEVPPALEGEDRERLIQCLLEQWAAGMSANDAVRYHKSSEEINPYLREDVGIARMRAVSEKYGKVSTGSPGWTKD